MTLIEAIRGYLANDGSQRIYDSAKASKYRELLLHFTTKHMPTTHTAEEIIEASIQHFRTLIGRGWPEASAVLEDESEITLNFTLKVTDSDDDKSITSKISFGRTKYKDSYESALDDPSQPELALDGTQEPDSDPEEDGVGDDSGNEETGHHVAAAIDQLPPLPFQMNALSTESGDRFYAEFKRSAKEAQWPEDGIRSVGSIIKECNSITEMQEVLKPYLSK